MEWLLQIFLCLLDALPNFLGTWKRDPFFLYFDYFKANWGRQNMKMMHSKKKKIIVKILQPVRKQITSILQFSLPHYSATQTGS